MRVWITVGCLDYSSSYVLAAHSTEDQARAFAATETPRRFDQVEIYECVIDGSQEPKMVRAVIPGEER
jgi:hypothetical protein